MTVWEKLAPDNEGYALCCLGRFLRDQKRRGIGTVTLWGGSPHIFVDSYGTSDLTGVRKQLADSGLGAVCYRPAAYGYTLCAEAGSLLRTASLDYYRYSAQAAGQLSIPLMTAEIGGGCMDQEVDRQLALAADGIRCLAYECEDQGIRLAVGTGCAEDGALVINLESLETFLESTGNGNIGICLNLKAMCQAGETLEDWFEAFGKRICRIRADENTKKLADRAYRLGFQGFCGYTESPERIGGASDG